MSVFFSFSPVFAYFFNSENNRKLVSSPPTAININNFPIQNISGRSQILPLIGNDSDGTIISFKILSLPNSAHGILYLNDVVVGINQVLNPVQAKQLQFEVKSTFTGTASFTYTTTDNDGNSDDSAAIFSIPVTDNGTLLVCTGGGLGNNILGAQGTFSSPFITANATSSCINNNSTVASPLQNLGNAKPGLTNYNYASTSGGLGPEGTYSFLKTLGTMATRNCIKTDWVASDHTGDGGYAMIVNGSPNSATFGKTFYNASSIAVCPNTLYEFSAYVINVLPGNHSAALPGTEPNISFYINNQMVSTSGAIPYSNASTSFEPTWVKVGGLWYSGPNTSVNLRIDNATFVASGNDLGLDDISMAICGPEITYPDISLTPKFCSYGVLPLKANIVASINTYASYIFQNSTDGGLSWTDMGSPATGSPVYNTLTGSYEYQAIYGDIPIDPSMNGYRYRLKVATDASNLSGTTCNISADKIITVSAFEKPLAGADITGCNSSSTAKLKVAGSGETWASVAGNPAPATIDQSGNVSGMVSNGFYRFQLINSSGCADTVSVTRDEVSSAGTDVKICSSQNTYKFPDAGLGYKWIKFAGNPADASIDSLTGEVTGMSADGIYRFMLKSDYGGCTDDVSITRSTLILISNQTNVNCFGESTGSINLTVTGGTAPYSYSWSSGQTTEDISSLSAGSYIVTVTDSTGCTATDTILITQPLAALTLSSTQANINCFGESTGAINLTVSGGTAPYSYSWSSGQSTEDISSLTAGSYTVTVTDSKGCTATETITITQPLAVLAIASTQTNVNCFGESTGAINLTVSGGTAPYSYTWSSGQSTEDISSLAAGSYTITVTDSKGCTATETILITQPLAALTLSSTQTNINCFGESTGAINLTVSGGTAPYSYSWSSGQSTEDISSLAAGSYTITITDSKGCSATETILITQPLAALTLTTTQTNINCFGESTGAINLTVSGGTAPYSYSWSSGQTTEDISSLAAGSYTITVTDSKGCTATETILITQPLAALTLSSTQTNINCFGESTGAINLTVSGGTAPYSYNWSSGQSTEDLSSLTAGSYTVTVTDSKGCTATETIQITQPLAALTLSSTQTNINCFGESTGAINLTVSGGTAPYSYSWSSGQSTEDLSSLIAGSYTVTVTDSKGCTATE
ncbi:MAG TPA: SprB repeat-containing protein, partial [Daejeonella sp.]